MADGDRMVTLINVQNGARRRVNERRARLIDAQSTLWVREEYAVPCPHCGRVMKADPTEARA